MLAYAGAAHANVLNAMPVTDDQWDDIERDTRPVGAMREMLAEEAAWRVARESLPIGRSTFARSITEVC